MDNKYKKSAQAILLNIKYATLATVTPESKAWNSPVAHEIDSALNVYWTSDKENQHSINIRHIPSVFIVIYDSQAPEGEGEGVYIEADAIELTDAGEIASICNRSGLLVFADASSFIGDSIRRVYKAVPKRIWINDAEFENGEFVRDFKIELPIEELI